MNFSAMYKQSLIHPELTGDVRDMTLIGRKEAGMAGRLTDEDMTQLEAWIGTGSKAFTLLYSIARDACDPAAFHRLCDNQGPTVKFTFVLHYMGHQNNS